MLMLDVCCVLRWAFGMGIRAVHTYRWDGDARWVCPWQQLGGWFFLFCLGVFWVAFWDVICGFGTQYIRRVDALDGLGS